MIKKYTLKNLDCASCAHKIENMINQREDINEATLSFANGLLICLLYTSDAADEL